MSKKPKNYNEAFQELNSILTNISGPVADIDTLEGQIDRAAELLAYCKLKLYKIEERLAEKSKEEPN